MKQHLYRISLAAALLSGKVAHGQFTGSDDFKDNTLSPVKWNRLIEEDATMVASGQRLLFTHSAMASEANCITSWKELASGLSNWVAQVDVRVPFLPLECRQRIEIGLVVAKVGVDGVPQPDDPIVDLYQRIEPDLYPGDTCQDAWRAGRTVWSAAGRINMDGHDYDHAQVPCASTLVSLRLRWDATEGALMSEYDPNGPIDGFQWTLLSCRHLADYGWGAIDRFLVNLYAYSENCHLTVADGVGLDNFKASYLTPPSAGAMLAVPQVSGASVALSVQSEPSVSYTLEAKNHVTQPDWRPIATVLGNGSTVTLTDPDRSAPLRFYRLRNP